MAGGSGPLHFLARNGDAAKLINMMVNNFLLFTVDAKYRF
jgi:hypothetical protein